MSLSVELRDGRGAPIDAPRRWPGWRVAREGPQPVWNWRPPAADHVGFPLMAGIDPYGNTVFNRQQAVSLLAELRTWRATCDPEQADMTDEIIRLAEACRDQSHAYLWFVGD